MDGQVAAVIRILRRLFCCVAALALWARAAGVGEVIPRVVPGLLEPGVTLEPGARITLKVGVGRAKFLRFGCGGRPGDALITLRSRAVQADPLLVLSVDPDSPPSLRRHHFSTFEQWRFGGGVATQGTVARDVWALAQNVGPRGGIVGIVNMRHFAIEDLVGELEIRCSFTVVFDPLFWDHLRTHRVCPLGEQQARGEAPWLFCFGRGRCSDHGDCVCRAGYVGPACEHSSEDITVTGIEGTHSLEIPEGRFQYFRVGWLASFQSGFLHVKVRGDSPMILLASRSGFPTTVDFDVADFSDASTSDGRDVAVRLRLPPLATSALNVAGAGSSVGAALHAAATKTARPHLYVGVFNPGPRPAAGFPGPIGVAAGDFAAARARTAAKVDVQFWIAADQEVLPQGESVRWSSFMYRPFHDLRHVDMTQHSVRAGDEQFFYRLRPANLDLVAYTPSRSASKSRVPSRLPVGVHGGRLALVRVEAVPFGAGVELRFSGGPSVLRVLASAGALPKTLFAFEEVLTPVEARTTVSGGPSGAGHVWCGILANGSGVIGVTAAVVAAAASAPEPPEFSRSSSSSSSASSDASSGASAAEASILDLLGGSPMGLVAGSVLVLCGVVAGRVLGLLALAWRANDSGAAAEGADEAPYVQVSERLAGMILGLRPPADHPSTGRGLLGSSRQQRDEGMGPLLRADSGSGSDGDLDPDACDSRAELRFLYRGGFGDDGL
eukprot:TRINITY_DN8844_c0_g1_i1.p1 TRINITY_DN8844_c0_g1~~TRINITY_DN8844_c0_g1_i1.p1  ORF type:complete len:723 (+),score=148.77 TRINITY_DN8844_c0_g1_i1:155-2323(+)